MNDMRGKCWIERILRFGVTKDENTLVPGLLVRWVTHTHVLKSGGGRRWPAGRVGNRVPVARKLPDDLRKQVGFAVTSPSKMDLPRSIAQRTITTPANPLTHNPSLLLFLHIAPYGEIDMIALSRARSHTFCPPFRSVRRHVRHVRRRLQ